MIFLTLHLKFSCYFFQPLQQTEWFGNPSGYHIHYTELGTGKQKDVVIEDPTANSHILEHLEEFALYEVTMASFNDVGASEQSPSAVERTRESVPSFGPLGVEANATSSTTIVVKWGEVPKEHQNGLIEGYVVLVWVTGSILVIAKVFLFTHQ